jgi:hypothetical protein
MKEPTLLRAFGGTKNGQLLSYPYGFNGDLKVPIAPKLTAVKFVSDDGSTSPTFVGPDIERYNFCCCLVWGRVYEYLTYEHVDPKTIKVLLFSLYNMFNWMSNPGRAQIITFEDYLRNLPPEFPYV